MKLEYAPGLSNKFLFFTFVPTIFRIVWVYANVLKFENVIFILHRKHEKVNMYTDVQEIII